MRSLYMKAAASVTALLACLPAFADVKVVSEVKVSGIPAQALEAAPEAGKPIVTTVYYKGDKQRTEAGDTVVIFDSATDTIYTLNTKDKTYIQTTTKTAAGAVADNPMLAMVDFNAKTFLKPTEEVSTIAGKESKKWKYTTIIKLGLKNGDPSMAALLPTITIAGEQWAAEGITLPFQALKQRQATQTSMLPPLFANSLKEMTEKLGQIKGLPLNSVVSVKFEGNAPGLPEQPIVTTTTVKTLSEDPLDDALFAVPADYKKVEAKTPAFPLPGGASPATL